MSVAIQIFLSLVFFGAGTYFGYRVGLEGGFLNFIEKGISRRQSVRRNPVVRNQDVRRNDVDVIRNQSVRRSYEWEDSDERK